MIARLYLPIFSDADMEVEIFCLPPIRDCLLDARGVQLFEVALKVLDICFVRQYCKGVVSKATPVEALVLVGIPRRLEQRKEGDCRRIY